MTKLRLIGDLPGYLAKPFAKAAERTIHEQKTSGKFGRGDWSCPNLSVSWSNPRATRAEKNGADTTVDITSC